MNIKYFCDITQLSWRTVYFLLLDKAMVYENVFHEWIEHAMPAKLKCKCVYSYCDGIWKWWIFVAKIC